MWLKIPGIACISSGGSLCVPTILRWAKTPQNSVHMLPHLYPAAPCTSAKAHNLSWLPASSYCPHLKYACVSSCLLYNNSAALQTTQNPPVFASVSSEHWQIMPVTLWSCILNMGFTGKGIASSDFYMTMPQSKLASHVLAFQIRFPCWSAFIHHSAEVWH